MKLYLIIIFVFGVLVFSCNSADNKSNIISNSVIQNDYAIGFVIEEFETYKKISVLNPWQNAENTKFEYYLFLRNHEIPDSLKNKNIILTPVHRIVCLSTTYLGFIEVLDERNSIVGISGTSFVYDSIIQNNIESEIISEVGFEQNLDIEKIISLKPDIVFAYDITGSISAKYSQLQKLGIQVVYVGEYLENEPLGKAEWLKFFAVFFNKEIQAEEYFNNIKTQYLNKMEQITEASSYPNILINIPFQGIWYLPGGKSYMAKIIEDAGGNYLWKNKEQTESFPISLEEVFQKNDEINILINPGISESINDIIKTENRLESLNCVKNKKIFNNNKRIGKNGGNDIWESGTVNPHLILSDLIIIFHQELFNEDELYYYQKLK